MPNRIRAWAPAASWAALLFFLSALPNVPGSADFPHADKLAHFVLYAVLGALLARGRARSGGEPSHVLLLVVGAAYGLTDEWHQAFVPGRMPDVVDWVADLAGLATGYVAVVRCGPSHPRSTRTGTTRTSTPGTEESA